MRSSSGNRILNSVLKISEPIMLVFVFVVLAYCAVTKAESSAAITLFAAILSCLPFFLRYELKRPKPGEIMPIVVLSAVAVVGRLALVPIPNFQPVSALVIFTGVFFGRQNGYLMGAFTALVSNMILGQGLWTPLQMYAWGFMGYIAGVLSENGFFGKGGYDKTSRRRVLVYVYGVLASLLYNLFMDTWFIVTFLKDATPAVALSAYGAGFVLGISHITATALFLVLTVAPWGAKIRRIKIKYGL
ncbi:MAG: ECF transporter S component [Clostridiales Family XIII bacterium]|jgi:energy-coupling factor transport system substrate-specific component|nr:ECF transporter S component [Clostridiales Family XIII bacterium]